jgi:plastocyanin domain-containing protein
VAKRQHTTKTLAIAAAIPALVIAVMAFVSASRSPPAPKPAQIVEATATPVGEGNDVFEIRVTVGKDSVQPNVIYAAAGMVLHLRVRREGPGACPGPFGAPALGVTAKLEGEETTVTLPWKGERTVTLACGEAMVGVVRYQ